MPGLEVDRVAEILVTLGADGPGRRGSGYRVTTTIVLTAAHVVQDASTVRVRFEADTAEVVPARFGLMLSATS